MRSLWTVPLTLALACQAPSDTDAPPPPDSETERDSDSAPADTPDTPDDADPPRATLEASGPIPCADPTERDLRGRFQRRTFDVPPPPTPHLEGANASYGDLDGDGLVDVIVTTHTRVLVWYRTAGLPLPDTVPVVVHEDLTGTEVSGLFGTTVVDVDDDGDLDLMITGRKVANHLLRNDGGRAFTDVTEASGLAFLPDHHTTGASFADMDGDGDLDLFLAGHGYVDETLESPTLFQPADPSLLYENTGGGQFVDVSHLLPAAAQRGYTFLGGWFDADGDGDDDLYLLNDFGGAVVPCQLLINELREGGGFRADDNASGADAAFAGMGLGIGDYDHDGDEDLAVVAWKRNHFYLHQGPLFFESASAMGFQPELPQAVGWGAEMADIDNNGRLDIATAYGYLETRFGGDNTLGQPDAFWIQQDDGTVRDQAALGGLDDRQPHRVMALADYTQDGWLDLVRVGLDGVVRFDLSRCGDDAWVTVQLHQPAPNTGAVGATVRVTAGGVTQLRRVRAGGTGYGNGQPLELHFGLGEAALIDALEVQWPDGQVETWTDLTPRQRLHLRR